MTLMFHFFPMKIQFTSHSNDILSHIQRGLDECMHLIFKGCSSRDYLAFTAMLNCRSLKAPERHINAWAIFGQHIASSAVIPNSFTSRFLLYSCMSAETKRDLPSHSKILRNFSMTPPELGHCWSPRKHIWQLLPPVLSTLRALLGACVRTKSKSSLAHVTKG